MIRADLVAAVRADQEQRGGLAAREQRLEQRVAARIAPLQIVEADDQRMLRRRADRDEASQCEREPYLRLARTQRGHGRHLAEDEAEVGNQLDERSGDVAEARAQLVLPALEARIALDQPLMNQAPEHREPGVVRSIAIRVGLADGEIE